MKFVTSAAALVLSAGIAAPAFAVDITGAGATFPYPIYAKWAEAYKAKSGVGMNYQSIGSGGGIKQIKAKTVDFGASDMPLKAEELEKDGLTQFPAIMGGVVPVVNIPGIKPGQLKVTGQILADIYLGTIKKWNDAALVKLNPGVKLPEQDILAVHRSDGSGTSFLFTDYLSKISTDWKSKVGAGTAVAWPKDNSTAVGGKGNEGVAAYVQRLNGAIGYVEYAYAKKNKMSHMALLNKDGKYVQPDDASFQAAAANADWAKAPGFYLVLTEQPGAQSWPITGASFILLHKTQADAAKGKEVLSFFDWAFQNGGKMASELDYVAMPASVVKLIQSSWKANLKDAAGKAVW